MVRHIVFWKIKDDENKQSNLEKMRELLLTLAGKASGIVSTEIGFNFSSSDYDIILDAVFSDPFALKQYQTHPEYMKLKKFTDAILIDRVVCDYMIDLKDSVSTGIPMNNLTKSESISSQQNSGSMSGSRSQNNNSGNSAPNNSRSNVDSSMSMNNQPSEDSYGNFDNYSNRSMNSQRGSNNMSNSGQNVANSNTLSKQLISNEKRDTLAMSSNVQDSAFDLPYEKNYQPTDNNFSATPYTNDNNGYDNADPYKFNQPGRNDASRQQSQRALGNTGNIPYVNPKNMIQQPQNSMLINTGIIPNSPMDSMPDMNPQRNSRSSKMDGMNFNPMQNDPSMDVPWKCVQCGKLNPMFTNVCSCGRRKPSGKNPPVPAGNRGNNFQPNANYMEDDFDNSYNPQQNSRSQGRKSPSNLSLPGPGTSSMETSIFDTGNEPTMRIEPKGTSDRTMVNAWTCPTCGKVNGDFVGLCGCGQRKPGPGDYMNNDPYQSKNARKPLGRSSKQQTSNFRGNDPFSNFKSKAPSGNDPYFEENIYDMDDQSSVISMGKGSSPSRQGMNTDSWKCPRCGKVHGNYVGQCGCGQRKPSRNQLPY